MSARSNAARVTVLVAFIGLLLTSCGSDGGDGTGGGSPAQPSGPATISGTLTMNGDPVADQDVTLGPAIAPTGPSGASGGTASTGASGATGPTGPSATTGADGTFTFADVQPGSYSLSVGVHVVNAASSGDIFSGLGWDDPCKAEGFQVFNVPVSDKSTGEPAGVIASVSSQQTSTNADQVTPVEVATGEQVTADIALVCTTA